MSWLAQLKSIPRTDSRSEAADKTDETPVLSVMSGRPGERSLGPAPSDDPYADDNDAREERAEVIEFDGGMTRAEAERVVAEVLDYFSESLEGFVTRRHAELQGEELKNVEIFARILAEARQRRFAAPALSERQVRRMVYG